MYFFNKKGRFILFSLLVVVVALISTSVYAQPMPNVYKGGNRWTITAFDDTSPIHQEWATQGICFLPPKTVGTHMRGYWYSYTYPDWNGTWSQEGDQVFMYGDYAKDIGHDGITFEIFSNSEASGHWHEWREDGKFGRTIGFANTKLRRVGSCWVLEPNDLSNLDIKPRLRKDGREVVGPLDKEQIPILLDEGLVKR